ncbi:MAG: hypothetical protein Q7S22_04730, partial [Candidatus Micrarchaeota archaeon]|nr:hypothetical protein [Candidatus Micrarchaeota archaeon]
MTRLTKWFTTKIFLMKLELKYQSTKNQDLLHQHFMPKASKAVSTARMLVTRSSAEGSKSFL